jgi:hypothetical protein
MPNLWTNTYQRVCEAFSGPRTKDTEFDAKVEEMRVLEKAISQIKTIFPNFQKNTIGRLC